MKKSKPNPAAQALGKFCQINYATWWCSEHERGLDADGVCHGKLKNKAAVKLGRLGGKARAKALTSEERRRIAKKAWEASVRSPNHPNNRKRDSGQSGAK